MDGKELRAQFERPGSAYRGKPFWSWNGELEKGELLRQMDVAVRDADRDSRRSVAQAGGDFFMEQGVDHAFFPFLIAAFLSSVGAGAAAGSVGSLVSTAAGATASASSGAAASARGGRIAGLGGGAADYDAGLPRCREAD